MSRLSPRNSSDGCAPQKPAVPVERGEIEEVIEPPYALTARKGSSPQVRGGVTLHWIPNPDVTQARGCGTLKGNINSRAIP